jgi:hypothetical protein
MYGKLKLWGVVLFFLGGLFNVSVTAAASPCICHSAVSCGTLQAPAQKKGRTCCHVPEHVSSQKWYIARLTLAFEHPQSTVDSDSQP